MPGVPGTTAIYLVCRWLVWEIMGCKGPATMWGWLCSLSWHRSSMSLTSGEQTDGAVQT